MSAPPPRALLFDWDDTLVDNWQSIHDALNTTLAAMGEATWTLDQTLRRVGRSTGDGFPRLFGERWREAQTIFYDKFGQNHLRALRVLPHAEETLTQLSSAGLYLAVVSNKNGIYLRREAAYLGWSRYFNRLVGAADAAADKPAIDAVALALESSGLTLDPTIWFVGDSEIDIECARNASLTAVLLKGGRRRRAMAFDPGETMQLSGCAELLRTVTAAIDHR